MGVIAWEGKVIGGHEENNAAATMRLSLFLPFVVGGGWHERHRVFAPSLFSYECAWPLLFPFTAGILNISLLQGGAYGQVPTPAVSLLIFFDRGEGKGKEQACIPVWRRHAGSIVPREDQKKRVFVLENVRPLFVRQVHRLRCP